jgi:hypothetical protein
MNQSLCVRIRIQANHTLVILHYTRVRDRIHINACIESRSQLITLRSFCGLSEPQLTSLQRGTGAARLPYRSIHAKTAPLLITY